MNAAHFHLMVNHFPIIGTIIGALILVFAMMFKNNVSFKTGLLVLVFAALTTIPTFLTGEDAEDKVEQIEGVNEEYIETHEHQAETFIWVIGATGLLSLLTFFMKTNSSITSGFKIITLLLAFITIYYGVQISNSGGEIRHTEIRAE